MKKLAVLLLLAGSDTAQARLIAGPPPPPRPAVPIAAFSPTPATPPGAVPMTREAMQQQLDEFDRLLKAIDDIYAHWHAPPSMPKDTRGADIVSDLKRYLLTPEDRARLAASRVSAQQQFDAGDWPGVMVAVAPAARELNAAGMRFGDIVKYWHWRPSHDLQIQQWAKVVLANGVADPDAAMLSELEQRLDGAVATGDFAAAVHRDVPALDALYRHSLDAARAAVAPASLKADPLRRDGVRPCVDPPVPVPVRAPEPAYSIPKVDIERSNSTETYYPKWGRWLQIQGVATMQVQVSPHGCIREARIMRSSGSEVLDQAALDWSVTGAAFVPARLNGEVVDGSAVFNVRFSMVPWK